MCVVASSERTMPSDSYAPLRRPAFRRFLTGAQALTLSNQVMAITAGYGVIGYLDDYLKIKHRSTGGLAGRWKLVGQTAIAGVVMSWCFLDSSGMPSDWLEIRDHLSIPFVAFSKHPVRLPLAVYLSLIHI